MPMATVKVAPHTCKPAAPPPIQILLAGWPGPSYLTGELASAFLIPLITHARLKFSRIHTRVPVPPIPLAQCFEAPEKSQPPGSKHFCEKLNLTHLRGKVITKGPEKV